MIIAERKFIVDSSQPRIWSLLLKAILRFMPFERIRPRGERSASALLRVGIGFISLPVDVEIEVVKTIAPDSMETLLTAEGMRGIIKLKQRATFALRPIAEDKTEVVCKIAGEEVGIMVRVFLFWRVKAIAKDAFIKLEERLRQWA